MIKAVRADISLIALDQILQKLKPAPMDASERSPCLEGTREEIIQSVIAWASNSSRERVLWLHGLAGSGKSTLSTTIANIFASYGQLGAFLFFERDVIERSNPTTVVRTLAHQLGSSDRRIGQAICAVIERNPNILLLPLSLQFQKLILDALSTVDALPPTIVVVLDALDECGSANERETLLTILANGFGGLPFQIRTIITSRPEADICNAFQSQCHILPVQLDITSLTNSNDIRLYIRHRMALLRTQARHLQLDTEWPGEEALCQLVQRASGLFVWASTACNFIAGFDPRRRLDVILRGEMASGPEAALDGIYKTALKSIDIWDDEEFVSDFRAILGLILVARQPLSSASIDILLKLPNERPSMHTISLLGSILQQGPTIRLLHPSFADFLVTIERCGRDIWYFDRPTFHQDLALRCLDDMEAVLKQNICNLTLTTDVATESLPEDASYSCSFWIDHISAIVDEFALITDQLSNFMLHHLLHWFEAMSISKRSRDTILLLDRLSDWILVSHSATHDIIFLKI